MGEKQPYAPIWVGRSKKGPIVLYQRGKGGEYLVNLNTKDHYWCQYAFQFSHEIGHILCGYRDGDSSNLWFEETLGEVASLYTLLRLEAEWEKSPPYPHWKEYAKEFTRYAEERIKKYRKEVPEDLEEWFVQNEISLAKEPVNRPRNVALATRLLPLFDKFPEGWAACSYLNEKKSKESKSFSFHLNDWFLSCPHQAQKKFIRKVASQFGILLPFNQISDKDEQESKP